MKESQFKNEHYMSKLQEGIDKRNKVKHDEQTKKQILENEMNFVRNMRTLALEKANVMRKQDEDLKTTLENAQKIFDFLTTEGVYQDAILAV